MKWEKVPSNQFKDGLAEPYNCGVEVVELEAEDENGIHMVDVVRFYPMASLSSSGGI